MRRQGKHKRRRGIALVEYALATPLLLTILAVGLDYGKAMRTAGAVSAAARAGAAWGALSPINAANISGMQSAAVNSAPDISGLTVTASQSCQCSGGSAVSCTGSCSGNMLMYVRVNAKATVTSFFSYSGLSMGGTTSAQATMRVQ